MFGLEKRSLAVSTANTLRSNSLMDAWLIVRIKTIAFGLSIVTFSSGVTLISYPHLSQVGYTRYAALGFIIVISVVIAFVCEALTIASSKKLGANEEALKALKKLHNDEKEDDASTAVTDFKNSQLKELTNKRSYYIFSIAITTVVSFLGGLLFWHFILGSDIFGWGVSCCFSTLVSLALTYSTLTEKATKEIVDVSLLDDDYIQRAVKSDVAVELSYKYGTSLRKVFKREGDDMQEVVIDAFRDLVDTHISNGDGTLKLRLEEKAISRRQKEQKQIKRLQGENEEIWSTNESTAIVNIPQKQMQRNIQSIKDMLSKYGNDYVQERVADGNLASQLGVTSPTVYRYLRIIKGEKIEDTTKEVSE